MTLSGGLCLGIFNVAPMYKVVGSTIVSYGIGGAKILVLSDPLVAASGGRGGTINRVHAGSTKG